MWEYITTHYGNTVDEYNEILQYFIPIDITGHNYYMILTSVLNQFFTVYCIISCHLILILHSGYYNAIYNVCIYNM